VITASARRKPGQPGRGIRARLSLLRLLAEWEQGIAAALLPARLGRGGHDGQMAAVASTSEARRADRLAGASTTVRSISELQSPSVSLTGLRRMVAW
jgi:hypothetical protein